MQDVMIFTGGAGFIGCATAGRFAGQAEKIVAIDNLHPQVHRTPGRPASLPEHVELVVADVRDDEFWDEFLKSHRPKTVVHLAAETGTAQSLSESNRHASVNVVGTTQMLDAFTRAGVLPKHIVLASSRAVYGEGAWQTPEGTTFYPPLRAHERLERGEWGFVSSTGDATPLPHRASQVHPNPSSVYGATKLAQEHIIKAWSAAMRVPATILRFQNVYGPGQSPFNPYTGIINLFHRTAFNGGTIEVYEDGNIGRDFVFIDDVVDAVVAAIAQPPAVVRTLDVGTGQATTILEAARYIAELYGAPEPIITGKFRDGDIRWAVADVCELNYELGVQCQTDFLVTGAKRVGDWLIAEDYMS
jgi:dTDP-L-rhamnose 4-epimerase